MSEPRWHCFARWSCGCEESVTLDQYFELEFEVEYTCATHGACTLHRKSRRT